MERYKINLAVKLTPSDQKALDLLGQNLDMDKSSAVRYAIRVMAVASSDTDDVRPELDISAAMATLAGKK
jgi:hypothetical protein